MVDLSIVFCMFTRGYSDLPNHPNVVVFLSMSRATNTNVWWVEILILVAQKNPCESLGSLGSLHLRQQWVPILWNINCWDPKKLLYIYNINIYIIQCYWIITYNTYINSWNPQKACKKLLYKHLICPYYPPNRKWVIDKPLFINHIDRLISMHLPK